MASAAEEKEMEHGGHEHEVRRGREGGRGEALRRIKIALSSAADLKITAARPPGKLSRPRGEE